MGRRAGEDEWAEFCEGAWGSSGTVDQTQCVLGRMGAAVVVCVL